MAALSAAAKAAVATKIPISNTRHVSVTLFILIPFLLIVEECEMTEFLNLNNPASNHLLPVGCLKTNGGPSEGSGEDAKYGMGKPPLQDFYHVHNDGATTIPPFVVASLVLGNDIEKCASFPQTTMTLGVTTKHERLIS
jgi:hypothetical protein